MERFSRGALSVTARASRAAAASASASAVGTGSRAATMSAAAPAVGDEYTGFGSSLLAVANRAVSAIPEEVMEELSRRPVRGAAAAAADEFEVPRIPHLLPMTRTVLNKFEKVCTSPELLTDRSNLPSSWYDPGRVFPRASEWKEVLTSLHLK